MVSQGNMIFDMHQIFGAVAKTNGRMDKQDKTPAFEGGNYIKPKKSGKVYHKNEFLYNIYYKCVASH